MSDATDLRALLLSEERVYDQLIELATRESAAVIANEVATLEGIVARKAELTFELDRLEARRLEWLRAFAAERGVADVTLSEVARLNPQPVAADLLALKDRLGERVMRIAEQNKRNGLLIASVLRIVGQTIETLKVVRGDREQYTPNGQRRSNLRPALLNMKA